MRGLLMCLIAVALIAFGLPTAAQANITQDTTITLNAGDVLPDGAVLVASEVATLDVALVGLTVEAKAIGCEKGVCNTRRRPLKAALRVALAPVRFVAKRKPRIFHRNRGCRSCRR